MLQRISIGANGPHGRRLAGRVVASGLLVYALYWLSILGLTHLSPPTDNLEQLVWVRSLEWGYYKHPPLVTWLMWPFVQLFGLQVGLTYALGALCKLAALGLLWWLLRDIRGQHQAHIGLLAALCITFYNERLHYYNHNVVLLLISTGCAFTAWLAATTGRPRWWLAVGVLLGLGALTKYQIVVTGLCLMVFVWRLGLWRQTDHLRHMLAGLGIAALMFLPHLVWLRDHAFAPLSYARSSSDQGSLSMGAAAGASLNWLADQVLNRAMPGILLLLLALAPWRAVVREHFLLRQPPVPAAQAGHVLLWTWALVPLVFMFVLGLATGAKLQLHWGTPFLLFLLPALMTLWPNAAWQTVRTGRVVLLFCMLQAAVMVATVMYSPYGPGPLKYRYWRSFDAAALVGQMEPAVQAQAGRAVQVIAGPHPMASALGIHWPGHPLVLLDGRLDRSPWVSPQSLDSGPVLEIACHSDGQGWHAVGEPFTGMAWRLWVDEDIRAAKARTGLGPAAMAQALADNSRPVEKNWWRSGCP